MTIVTIVIDYRRWCSVTINHNRTIVVAADHNGPLQCDMPISSLLDYLTLFYQHWTFHRSNARWITRTLGVPNGGWLWPQKPHIFTFFCVWLYFPIRLIKVRQNTLYIPNGNVWILNREYSTTHTKKTVTIKGVRSRNRGVSWKCKGDTNTKMGTLWSIEVKAIWSSIYNMCLCKSLPHNTIRVHLDGSFHLLLLLLLG